MTAIELNWFRLGAVGIMAVALLGSLAITDSALTFVSQSTSGGISNYTPCKDAPNVSCPNGGSTGITTSSCPSSPASPCWTQVQHGFASCTIIPGGLNCIPIITFSPAYSTIPVPWESYNGTPPSPTHTYTTSTPNAPISLVLPFQADNSTKWTNVPAVDTELYGKTNQRLLWTTPSTFTSQTAQFCTTVSDFLTAAVPQFSVQYATSQSGPWSYMGDANFKTNPVGNGFLCGSSESISLSAATTYYFRVVGNDAGSPVNIALGTIELFISGIGSQNTTTSATVACYLSIYSVTATTLRLRVGCSATVDSSTSFNLNWWVGIPA